MRNGYTIDTLTSVAIQENVKKGRKVIEIYDGVENREYFKISPFRKIIDKLFTLGKKYKDEKIDLMQGLVKLIMNSLYGVQMRKNINEFLYCQSETWMKTEYDENVLVHWKVPNDSFFVKMKNDEKLDDYCDNKNIFSAYLRAFFLGNCKRIMINFIKKIDGFYKKNIF